ncbi:MAG: hypothetical protein H6Q15_2314 [Bacteroidetes bacterium]|nr:hypothetical protein [Bacteroidota bacterium]
MTSKPIYLHFFDRELRSVEMANFTDNEVFKCIFYACFITDSYLYLGSSILWESTKLFPKSSDLIKELESIKLVKIVNSHSTIDEFLTSREKLYLHDKARYPMYFAGSEKYWGKYPILFPDSTTKILRRNILDWIDKSEKTNIIIDKVDAIEETIRYQKEKAITISLFKQHISLKKEEELILARLISTFYTQRYVSFLNGTIMTGIRRLVKYDNISEEEFPNYDIVIYSDLLYPLLFNGLKIEDIPLEKLVTLIICLKSSPYYQYFLVECKDLINAIRQIECPKETNLELIRDSILLFIQYKIKPLLSTHKDISDITEGLGYLRSIKYSLSKDYPFIKNHNTKTNMKKILLVVATMTELKMVIEFYEKELGNANQFSIDSHTYWNLGIIKDTELYLFKTAMGAKGQSGAILSISDAITAINPEYIIQVGICFGLKPKNQQLTEVLVSNVLQDYESSKVTTNGITPRGDRMPSDATLIDRFEAASVSWNKTKIHFGLILTGEKLADSEDFVKQLQKGFPDAIGGEMEGGGLLSSAHRDKKRWILIKGICDWGFNKDDKYQEKAALNAIEFINHTLKTTAL